MKRHPPQEKSGGNNEARTATDASSGGGARALRRLVPRAGSTLGRETPEPPPLPTVPPRTDPPGQLHTVSTLMSNRIDLLTISPVFSAG